ncbi:MAG: cytochrome b/b6 domain-containing protein [Acidimicrobiia bacterium]
MSAPDAGRVQRFTRAERITHWVNATLWGLALLSGLYFKFGWGQSLLTDREMVRIAHVVIGFAIIGVFAVSVLGRYGAARRRDLGRFNRWSHDDVRWLRSFGGDRKVQLGKFNPGQKLNASFIGAAAVIMAGTGSIMYWNKPFSTDLRTGADFVHQSFFYLAGIVIVGHIVMALRDREALQGMIGGDVSATWARRHAPRWLLELEAPPVAREETDGTGTAREGATLDA